MAKKKNNNKSNTDNFPFSNEIKAAKNAFKRMVDDMSDEEFIAFVGLITLIAEDYDLEDIGYDYEDFEDFEDFDYLDDEEVPF